MLILRNILIISAFAFLAGCSALDIESSVNLEETKELFNSARHAGAAVKSPYEFYCAEIYLKQAVNEYKNGDNTSGDHYLEKAHAKSALAYQNAKKFKKIELR
jgi:Domain of unknown function (DUF4398)